MAVSHVKMHHDEVEIDVPLVRRLLADQFPEWADRPVRRIESAGTVNAIFRIGEEMVGRFPLTERFAGGIDTEGDVLAMLAPFLPLEIPKVLAIGSPAHGYPFRWAVHGWIRGDVWTIDRVDDIHTAAEDLATFITAMHAIDRDGPRVGRWRGRPLADSDALVRKAISSTAGIVPIDKVTADWEEAVCAPRWDGPPVWIHSDLFPTNLLLQAGRLHAVIDFGGCGRGDPAVDCSCAWSLFPGEVRLHFRDLLSVDDATWGRARGYALAAAVQALPYYRQSNPTFAEIARMQLEEILRDRED